MSQSVELHGKMQAVLGYWNAKHKAGNGVGTVSCSLEGGCKG